jgi:hypothetical protein
MSERQFTKSWETLKRERPMNKERVAAYERLMEAQHRVASARARAGVTDAEIDYALEACEPDNPESLSHDELYLGTIARFVAALGGRLDGVSAVFGDERVDLPAPEKGCGGS